MVLAVWSGVTYTNTCFVKWSWNTRTLATLSSLFSSMVISMLVKSMCKRSNRAVATIRCRGTLGNAPSCLKLQAQDFIDCCIFLIMPGHQKHSLSRDKVQSHPWWPASLWHPFKAVAWCALGTMKSKRSSFLPLVVDHRYKAPWWTVKFCQFLMISFAFFTRCVFCQKHFQICLLMHF